MSQPRLQIIVGSTRPGRRGSPVGRWFHDLAVRHDRFDVELIELAEVGLPLLDEPHPASSGQYVHEHTRRWSETIAAGDAYVFVVPEHNHSYNAATKNALDFLSAEWQRKPIGFVSYGAVSGGARATQALTPVVVALGLRPLSRAVHIPLVNRLVAEDGTLRADQRLTGGALTLLDDLVQVTSSPAVV
ncbi:NADPH-dependent FMN reductase [Kutzneria sp. NPDC052558]|uniref:NADPH-dependent FMN reductase n=1 Tax=Kutzneria sp. NPDC052558 TaxID=3364121 RepID=UPI0037CCB6BE